MRTIKFRAWDKGKKEMLFDPIEYEVRCLSYDDDPKRKPDLFIGFTNMVEQWFEIMQFTGLLDKNGVEIYEGDIVKSKYGFTDEDIFLTVKWYEDGARFQLSTINYQEDKDNVYDFDMTGWGRDEINSEIIEVIGNIHQNPNLL